MNRSQCHKKTPGTESAWSANGAMRSSDTPAVRPGRDAAAPASAVADQSRDDQLLRIRSEKNLRRLQEFLLGHDPGEEHAEAKEPARAGATRADGGEQEALGMPTQLLQALREHDWQDPEAHALLSDTARLAAAVQHLWATDPEAILQFDAMRQWQLLEGAEADASVEAERAEAMPSPEQAGEAEQQQAAGRRQVGVKRNHQGQPKGQQKVQNVGMDAAARPEAENSGGASSKRASGGQDGEGAAKAVPAGRAACPERPLPEGGERCGPDGGGDGGAEGVEIRGSPQQRSEGRTGACCGGGLEPRPLGAAEGLRQPVVLEEPWVGELGDFIPLAGDGSDSEGGSEDAAGGAAPPAPPPRPQPARPAALEAEELEARYCICDWDGLMRKIKQEAEPRFSEIVDRAVRDTDAAYRGSMHAGYADARRRADAAVAKLRKRKEAAAAAEGAAAAIRGARPLAEGREWDLGWQHGTVQLKEREHGGVLPLELMPRFARKRSGSREAAGIAEADGKRWWSSRLRLIDLECGKPGLRPGKYRRKEESERAWDQMVLFCYGSRVGDEVLHYPQDRHCALEQGPLQPQRLLNLLTKYLDNCEAQVNPRGQGSSHRAPGDSTAGAGVSSSAQQADVPSSTAAAAAAADGGATSS